MLLCPSTPCLHRVLAAEASKMQSVSPTRSKTATVAQPGPPRVARPLEDDSCPPPAMALAASRPRRYSDVSLRSATRRRHVSNTANYPRPATQIDSAPPPADSPGSLIRPIWNVTSSDHTCWADAAARLRRAINLQPPAPHFRASDRAALAAAARRSRQRHPSSSSRE